MVQKEKETREGWWLWSTEMLVRGGRTSRGHYNSPISSYRCLTTEKLHVQANPAYLNFVFSYYTPIQHNHFHLDVHSMGM